MIASVATANTAFSLMNRQLLRVRRELNIEPNVLEVINEEAIPGNDNIGIIFESIPGDVLQPINAAQTYDLLEIDDYAPNVLDNIDRDGSS